MSIYVSGSLAFDRIMTFNGNFKDHILLDKLHILNISFMVDSMEERKGGCAGNIAYSLALMGEKAIIISSGGKDFKPYGNDLKKLGLSLEGITIYDDIYTALGYITTDMSSNQITGFYPGAMTRPSVYNFPKLNPDLDIAIISPGNVEDMINLPIFYRKHGIKYIFDPGQQLPVLSVENLKNAIQGSFALITNDYELNMICKRTGLSEDSLLGRTLWLITTLGEKGAHIKGADGTDIFVASAVIDKVVDPTGAGDAQRAGFLKGLISGLSVPQAAELGSISASYAIEKLGTQEHIYDFNSFKDRFKRTFFKDILINF